MIVGWYLYLAKYYFQPYNKRIHRSLHRWDKFVKWLASITEQIELARQGGANR